MASIIDSIIEEVQSEFSNYESTGLINEDYLYNMAVKAVKKFGNPAMTMYETVLDFKDGKAFLPDTFYSLKIAYLCEPEAYTNESKVRVDTLQNSFMYRERISKTEKWKEEDSCSTVVLENTITENLYLNGNLFKFKYKNPVLLKIDNNFKRTACLGDCRNKLVADCPYELKRNRDTLYANFNEGSVYMQYLGLPLTDEGDIDVPDTPNGHIEEFLAYHLKRKVAEKLIANNDSGPGINSLFSTYRREETLAQKSAKNELKMNSIDPNRLRRRIKRLNRKETMTFEIGSRLC